MVMLICYALMMSVAFGLNVPPVLVTSISETFGGLTNEQIGRIGGLIFLGVVAGVIAGGPAADRWKPKPFLVGASLLLSAGMLAFSLAPGYPSLCLAAALIGLGTGVVDLLLSPVVCALRPARKTAALNLLHAFYCIGSVCAALAGTLVLRIHGGWRPAAAILAVLPAACALALARLPLPPLVAAGEARTPLRALLSAPHLLLIVAAMAVVGAIEMGVSQWLPAYTEASLGFSKSTAGITFLVFSLGMGAGRIAIGLAGGHLHPTGLMMTGSVLSAALLSVAAIAPPHLAVAAAMASGLTVSVFWPAVVALGAERFPHGGATLFSLLAAAGNIGCMVMPWGVGVIRDRAGGRAGMFAVAVTAALFLLLLRGLRKSK